MMRLGLSVSAVQLRVCAVVKAKWAKDVKHTGRSSWLRWLFVARLAPCLVCGAVVARLSAAWQLTEHAVRVQQS